MRVVAIADTHLAPPGTAPARWHNPYRFESAARRLQRAVQIAEQEDADALVLLGDLSHLGDDRTLRRVVDALAEVESPVWVVPGNHDSLASPLTLAGAVHAADDPNVRLADARGRRFAGVRIAGAELRASTATGRFVVVPPPVAHWGSELTLWLTHYPVFSAAARFEEAGLVYPGDADNREAVAAALLARDWPTVVLSGHLHARDATTEGPVLQISTAALIEPPFELTVLDVTHAPIAVAARRVSVEESPDVRLPVLSPAEETWVFERRGWRHR